MKGGVTRLAIFRFFPRFLFETHLILEGGADEVLDDLGEVRARLVESESKEGPKLGLVEEREGVILEWVLEILLDVPEILLGDQKASLLSLGRVVNRVVLVDLADVAEVYLDDFSVLLALGDDGVSAEIEYAKLLETFELEDAGYFADAVILDQEDFQLRELFNLGSHSFDQVVGDVQAYQFPEVKNLLEYFEAVLAEIQLSERGQIFQATNSFDLVLGEV